MKAATHATPASAPHAAPGHAPIRGRVKSGLGPANQALQAKLEVGRSDDPLEHEADRIAERVVGGGIVPPNAPPSAPNSIQRKCASCAAEDDEKIQRQAENDNDEMVRTKGEGDSAPAQAVQAGAVAAAHAVSRSGAPLTAGQRAYFESRFGRDFSGVRIHTGAPVAAAAKAINARAFTLGANIGFATNRFAPETVEGRGLIAHELAHVVQQERAPRQAAVTIRRDEENGEPTPTPAAAPSDEATFTPEERAEEIKESRTLPGRISATTNPFRVTLENFAIDGASLKKEHKTVLDEVRSLLGRAKPGHLRLAIVGHTDSTGTEKHNAGLSHRRAWQTKALLGSVKGVQSVATGLGEARRAAPNGTREGRSQNRRVEIFMLPGPEIRRPDPEKPPDVKDEDPPPIPTDDDKPPGDEPPPGRDEPPREIVEPPVDVDPWFCAEHPIICAAIGGGAALFLFCLTNPLVCLPKIGPPVLPPGRPPGGDKRPDRPGDEPPDRPDKDKEPPEKRKEPPSPRTCLESASLPSGTIKAKKVVLDKRFMLKGPFTMGLVFRNDPDEGCDCSCGEYLQEVKGGFEENTGSGWTPARAPLTATGKPVHPKVFLEDADYPRAYGHRFEDPLRTVPTGPTDGDKFLPDQATGCSYSGSDSPGFNLVDPPAGSEYRFRLMFRGAAMDGCAFRTRIEDWHEWTVEGYMKIPEPPPPPPSTTTPPPPPTPPIPTPYVGPSIGPAPPGPLARAPKIGNPTLMCLSNQISCGALDHILTNRLGGLVLEDADRERAIALELRALQHHCTLFLGPSPTPLTPEVEERLRKVQALRRHAEKRVVNFLTWETRVVDHPLSLCP